MAFNTPYKLYKRYASHEGGIADTAIISWPNGIEAHGEVRDNYVNVCDITPTVYDLLGITPPAEVGGIAQKPLDGVSFKAALDDPSAPTGKDTQFYTMLGTRGIWHEGWFANTVHAATPAGWSHFDKDRWELFHIESDRSQCHDLAAENPDKLEELKELWFSEAAQVQRPAARRSEHPRDDDAVAARTWRASARPSPTTRAPPKSAWAPPSNRAASRSSVLAEVTIDTTGAEGVLFKHGGGHGGHVLFIQDGRLHYVYNFMGEEEQKVSSPDAVPLGKHIFGVASRVRARSRAVTRRSATSTLYIDGDAVASLPACQGASGNVRAGRRDDQRRAQHRLGGVEHVQGAVRIHGRHHRTGQRRPLGHAVCGRGEENSHWRSRRTDEAVWLDDARSCCA